MAKQKYVLKNLSDRVYDFSVAKVTKAATKTEPAVIDRVSIKLEAKSVSAERSEVLIESWQFDELKKNGHFKHELAASYITVYPALS